MRPLTGYFLFFLFTVGLFLCKPALALVSPTLSQRSIARIHCPAKTTIHSNDCHGKVDQKIRQQKWLTVFAASSEDFNNHDKDNERNKSLGRVGGRNKLKSTKKKSKEQGETRGIFWWIPALLLSLFLLKGIWFDPSFVYYESSVYESRTFDSDGRVETNRRESFRSNIPSLMRESSSSDSNVQRNELLRRQQDFLLDRSNIENDIREEFNSALRLQEAILDEVF